ncbi:MAG: CarD family transcriptional regulator, partial [Bacillota bacterium]|nr:CarD family transcriptional regulator [Bacillota bacterium]
MSKLIDILSEIPEYSSLLQKINSAQARFSLISGVQPVHKAHIVASAAYFTGKKCVVICPDESSCHRLCSDINSFLEHDAAAVLPARDFIFRNIEAVSREWEHKRICTLHGFLTDKYYIMTASAEALQQRAMPPAVLTDAAFLVKSSGKYSFDDMIRRLLRAGYRRSSAVEGEGQFSVRGGILDFFTPGEPQPVRIEFFGDEIDSLSYFDPGSQRRTEPCAEVTILPALETLPSYSDGGKEGLISSLRTLLKSKALLKNPAYLSTLEQDLERLSNEGIFPSVDRLIGEIYPGFASAIDYAPDDALFFIDDFARVKQSAKSCIKRTNDDLASLLEEGLLPPKHKGFFLDFSELLEKAEARRVTILDTFTAGSYDRPVRNVFNLSAKQLPSYGGSLETLTSDIKHYLSLNYSVLALAGSRGTALHLKEVLAANSVAAMIEFSGPQIPPKGTVLITVKNLSAGFEYPTLHLAVIAEGQTQTAEKRKKQTKKTAAERIRSYSDLTPGDLIVHEHHGIGRFSGIERMTVDGCERDYIKLAFAGTDFLYLPASSLDLISKYIGGGSEDSPVRLNKLGGAEWQKAKQKAKSAAKDLAKKLIQLYAERKKLEGFAFPQDSDWQREFEEAFEFDETDDQLRCTAEIKEDMEKPFPMDRLLCGDVGFGKTEVAFRAVMKCVLGGKQAAILVPTTVLARQHYMTAMRRFEGYPVKIEMLSRLRTPAEIKKSLSRLKSGMADLCIGTHRLLQKDVSFKDLGLLIVDEEQRFGVTHKERLKEISRKIDVLTLTATPIPRTLNMALSGIRDMSVLEE